MNESFARPREQNRKAMTIDPKDISFFAGVALLAVGIGAYDWRFAVIIIGAGLVTLGFYGYLKKYEGVAR
jgi:hypothetical protein